MSFKQPPALHELQYDALGASIVDNPYLPSSPIPSKNKALHTSKPYVTGAINELLQTIENIRNLVQTSLSQQQAVLGDFIADPTLLRDLQKVDSSVLKAIIKLSKMTQPESAYEIWLALGNTGSREDFLNSLKGADGQDSALPGPAGAAATIEIGEVLTGEAGTTVAVQNVGTETAAKLNFTIPRGEKGLVGDVNIIGPLEQETITCDIDKLQEEIDKLPKFLNKNVTINVNPGTAVNTDISIQEFYGKTLTIKGERYIDNTNTAAYQTPTKTHNINRIIIKNNQNIILLEGFNFLSTIDYAISIENCYRVGVTLCSSTLGVNTENNVFIISSATGSLHVCSCLAQNKSNALINITTTTHIFNCDGSNNASGTVAIGGIVITIGATFPANVLHAMYNGGLIVKKSGLIIGT
jgi:hypothetical protein